MILQKHSILNRIIGIFCICVIGEFLMRMLNKNNNCNNIFNLNATLLFHNCMTINIVTHSNVCYWHKKNNSNDNHANKGLFLFKIMFTFFILNFY